MKKIHVILLTLLTSILWTAQAQTKTENPSLKKQIESEVKSTVFKLFPTENYWTFIKLDTRNGKMWQVHFTISKEGFVGEQILNSESLVLSEEEINGRFTLYSTKNIYNFILLDQINGKIFQVQWNSEIEKRLVSKIN